MTEFKVGDRVELRNGGQRTNDAGIGTITEIVNDSYVALNFTEDFRSGSTTRDKAPLSSYPTSRLTLLEPRFVNVVVTQKTVWVTLPGDNAGHKLTNDDALTLLRQLEEALS